MLTLLVAYISSFFAWGLVYYATWRRAPAILP
jgi:hypothetical protein